jgi:hypothetical protein
LVQRSTGSFGLSSAAPSAVSFHRGSSAAQSFSASAASSLARSSATASGASANSGSRNKPRTMNLSSSTRDAASGNQ